MDLVQQMDEYVNILLCSSG